MSLLNGTLSDAKASTLRFVNGLALSALLSTESGRKFFDRLGRNYLAGSSLEEGLFSIKALNLRGFKSTFDTLGEDARNKEEADRYLEAYLSFIGLLGEEFHNQNPLDNPSISVKPSAICAVTEDGTRVLEITPLNSRLERIVSAAKQRRFNVTLDMEDHNWTDASLRVAQEIWQVGHDNFGIVLQSRLDRTLDDVTRVLERTEYPIPHNKIRVRACIGIYIEPPDIATRSKSEAKERLVVLVEKLFGAGVYVEVATHDRNVIDKVMNIIGKRRIPPSRFEFQFLRGVNEGEILGERVKGEGFRVRYYMPVELEPGAGRNYMIRRLRANPDLVFNGAKSLVPVSVVKFFR
ncbi:MAG: proline dehydrogenase family protein [Candidatus Woesearchaeota archaeon]|nr:MAG: proline dehydrogenase family protein [Candidatus Woesearchaeota archaeon]